MATANKKIARKIYEIFETGKIEEIDKYVDENVIEHTPDPAIPITADGRQYFKDMITSYRNYFPDIKFRIRDIMEEGERVVAFVTMTGTNSGSILGLPPTHRKIQIDCFDMVKIVNGKVVEHWNVYDNFSILNQLGILPDHLLHYYQAIPDPAREENITES